MVDADHLLAAYEAARADLLAERNADGHWIGELSSSALSTATAVSALSLMGSNASEASTTNLVQRATTYLATQQNSDGGFGDTNRSHSNIATTMLVRAAFHLAGAADQQEHRKLLQQAEQYIDAKGGLSGLRARYGKDKTFAVPILTNCALAGLVDWSEVSPLPFELAAFPQSWYRFFRLPVVSYAIPALVAIGQARYFHNKPRNPIVRMIRAAAIKRTLRVLEQMQPESGGYLEAIPLTSFVVMSLAGTGRARHPVAQHGVKFLLATARKDGSWPIDTNLATWVTSLAMNALATYGSASAPNSPASLKWLLSCQHNERHPFTGAAPGGWGWSDLSGAVPDADDTAGALLALAHADSAWISAGSNGNASGQPITDSRQSLVHSARHGLQWLLDLQNKDGGWPTFCRGWGALPFDRSAPDLTAHAIRALHAWLTFGKYGANPQSRLLASLDRGFRYLSRSQLSDGSWVPLWFGNHDDPNEENPVYGSARVLLAYRDCGKMDSQEAIRGVRWLIENQHSDGSFGTAVGRQTLLNSPMACGSSIEETTLAVEALLAGLDNRQLAADNSVQNAIRQGVDWVVDAVEHNRHRKPAPIGFYFAKLWYYEKLYPLIFTVSSLGEAAARLRHWTVQNELSETRPTCDIRVNRIRETA
jgi:squalene-hopene/tetraprenyl-beta-curcumene cyclase